ncbi:MAG: hypothetical protein DHS20C12_23810 [Pseudohongiella sp.]|nr:MAG: hypothetical protein DHS20C12_23810 [Pseudohongiella sp.]
MPSRVLLNLTSYPNTAYKHRNFLTGGPQGTAALPLTAHNNGMKKCFEISEPGSVYLVTKSGIKG